MDIAIQLERHPNHDIKLTPNNGKNPMPSVFPATIIEIAFPRPSLKYLPIEVTAVWVIKPCPINLNK